MHAALRIDGSLHRTSPAAPGPPADKPTGPAPPPPPAWRAWLLPLGLLLSLLVFYRPAVDEPATLSYSESSPQSTRGRWPG